MPELKFENNTYQINDFDSVLNSLLKNGHAIPNFCKSGYCHSCMMKAEEGIPLPFSQIGLAPELIKEKYFLTCQCAVYAPFKVCRPDKDKRTRFTAMVREKKKLSDQVVQIILAPEHDFVYQSGQYTTLINIEGLSHDFVIASSYGVDALMEFHITDDPDSSLSRYIFHELEEGDGLEIMTGLGDVYYGDEVKGKNLIFVTVDTGVSGAYSMIKKAVAEGHEGEIKLYHQNIDLKSCYIEDNLSLLAQGCSNFTYNINCEEGLEETLNNSMNPYLILSAQKEFETKISKIFKGLPFVSLFPHDDVLSSKLEGTRND